MKIPTTFLGGLRQYLSGEKERMPLAYNPLELVKKLIAKEVGKICKVVIKSKEQVSSHTKPRLYGLAKKNNHGIHSKKIIESQLKGE